MSKCSFLERFFSYSHRREEAEKFHLFLISIFLKKDDRKCLSARQLLVPSLQYFFMQNSDLAYIPRLRAYGKSHGLYTPSLPLQTLRASISTLRASKSLPHGLFQPSKTLTQFL
jgi:hypothetical protein